jgi:flagella basal body P-ring formation protein FlgA
MRLIRIAIAAGVLLAAGAAANGQPVQSLTGQVVGGQSVAARNAPVPAARVPGSAVAASDGAPADAARSVDVWEPTRMLLTGDIIRQDDIVARTLTRSYPEAVLASQDIVGQQVKRQVAANRPLTIRDIGPRAAVQANSPVTVLWSSGSLKMEMSARAMEAGAVGDEIRILNTASGRTIRGVVVGDDMIEVKAEQ